MWIWTDKFNGNTFVDLKPPIRNFDKLNVCPADRQWSFTQGWRVLTVDTKYVIKFSVQGVIERFHSNKCIRIYTKMLPYLRQILTEVTSHNQL